MVFIPKILAFAGSARIESFNRKLIKIAASSAQKAGAEVTLLELKEYPLPLYDGDLEQNQGLPENVLKLKSIFKEHHGFLISCPEYNSSITPLFKNTIDWISRSVPNEKPLECFTNKIITLMSASPGALGGLRGLVHVRSIFGNIGSIVLPTQVAISKAAEAFLPDGKLKDPKQQESVEKLGAGLFEFIKKLNF